MLPLRDTLKLTGTPAVTRALVVTNVVVFLAQLSSGKLGEVWVTIFGFVPLRLFEPSRFGYAPWEGVLTLFTSIFFHGGMVHLLGNMVYLWIFGDDVEELMGRWQFAVFYLACGAFGSLTHAFLYPASTIPSIGASGSIAGILGAFLVFHARAKIVALLPLVVPVLAEVPSALFLPVWFAMQFLNGFLSLSSARDVQEVASVAWWAHVGGFLFGIGIAGIVRGLRTED